MNEFKKYIESIGFINKNFCVYECGKFRINLYIKSYKLYFGGEVIICSYDDLTPLLKKLRSYKLKNILNDSI